MMNARDTRVADPEEVEMLFAAGEEETEEGEQEGEEEEGSPFGDDDEEDQ